MDEETKKKLFMLTGSRIRDARAGKLSQAQLATKINLKRTTVTSIEKGHHRIALDTLWNIAKILDLRTPDLLPQPEEVNLTLAEIARKTLTPSERKWFEGLTQEE